MGENNYGPDGVANRAKKTQISDGGFDSAQKPTREPVTGAPRPGETTAIKGQLQGAAKHDDAEYTKKPLTPPYDIADEG